MDAPQIHAVIMLQRAARPHAGGVVPLHNADSSAFQIFGRLDAGFAVDEHVGEAKLAVGKSRDRDMRYPFRVGTHSRGEATIPGVSLFLVGNEFPVKAVDLHRAVSNWNIGIDSRLAEIEF